MYDSVKELKEILIEVYDMYSGRLDDLKLKLKKGECDLIYKIYDAIREKDNV